ncbi:MAG: thioesterase family protein [Solirubrobacteraceae bacterium]
MTVEAVFVQDGERFTATELALGPWAEGALHGGATAALLAHVLEREPVAPGLRLARLTCELVAPAPPESLSVTVQTVRPGRRMTLLDAAVSDGGDREVCRARALLLAPSAVGPTPRMAPPFPGPEQGVGTQFHVRGRRMFATAAMDIRFVEGAFLELGAATAWFRLRQPLVSGRPVSPLERLMAAADFGNGIASVISWESHVFINPDLTVYVEREPEGEWVALQSEMRALPGSVAVAESVLWDQGGRIGRAVQSLIVGPRP